MKKLRLSKSRITAIKPALICLHVGKNRRRRAQMSLCINLETESLKKIKQMKKLSIIEKPNHSDKACAHLPARRQK